MSTSVILPTYTIGAWAANVDDNTGCRWMVTQQSLASGPGVKTFQMERPFGTGAYRARSYRKGRVVDLQGFCQAPDRVTRESARNLLLGLFPLGEQEPMTVYDGISTRVLTVELNDVVQVDIWEDGLGFDWKLVLFAADPRLLDMSVQSASATVVSVSTDGLDWATGGGLNWASGLYWGTSGSTGVIAMTNSGTATTYPVFKVTGPITNPTFTNPATGDVIGYTGTVTAGQTLTIDNSPFTSTVNLNGIDRSGALSSASWIDLLPNSTTVVQFAGSGTGVLTATWQNAYF